MSSSDFYWTNFTDQELLKLSFKELELSIKGSWVQKKVTKLYKELDKKKLRFKPHVWLSDEWFCPDGIAGFAIPFYVLSPRLARLHKKMGLTVEGCTPKGCMQLLRHETGHAIDNAFLLRKSKERQKLFGLSQTPYPEFYCPKIYSKKYVRHLKDHYAQSHPDEDWAETFAVWLTSKEWKTKYQDWPALEKLKFVNTHLKKYQNKKAKALRRETPENFAKSSLTLAEFYHSKREPLKKLKISSSLISKKPSSKESLKLSSFIKSNQKEILQRLTHKTSTPNYRIRFALDGLIENIKEQELYLQKPKAKEHRQIRHIVEEQALKAIKSGLDRIPM